MRGILVLAHGSRENETEKTMDAITDMVCAKLPDTVIETAYLQFRAKSLAVGLDSLLSKGITEITVVPYFLFEGLHIREDIPNEIDEYLQSHHGVNIRMGKTLGADERLADVLADRIRQAL